VTHTGATMAAHDPRVRVPVLIVAAAIGVAAGMGPVPAVLLAFGVACALLVVMPSLARRAFLACLLVLLVGYAFLGRGFAHTAIGPVFIGEPVVALAVVALLVGGRVRIDGLHLLLLGFMLLGLVRTVPYLHTYGIDALRDAVVWGYGLIAVALSNVLTRRSLETTVRLYAVLIVPFVLFVPLLAAAASTQVPGEAVPLLTLKPGDVAVHLGGVAGFALAGLTRSAAPLARARELLLLPAWLIAFGIASSYGRAALAAASFAVAGAATLKAPFRLTREAAVPAVIGLTVMVAVALARPSFTRDDVRASVSLDSIALNALSIVVETDDERREGTEEFRLRWWGQILAYTLTGDYFLGGKGFGINLADDDGFQLLSDHSLRAPHNSHLTILARMGVPGFVLWVTLQIAFAVSLIAAARRQRTKERGLYLGVMVWLFAYWVAMITNTAFDPYIESPQGGVWFWSVFGMGLAVLRLAREEAAPAAPSRSVTWAVPDRR
jgi:hypothetical protein